MAPRWIAAGGGRVVDAGARANAQAPSFANTTPPPQEPINIEDIDEPRLNPYEAGAAAAAAAGITTPAGPTSEDLYYDALRADLAARQQQERQGARAFLRGLLETYGLGSLAGEVERLVGDTTNELVIAQELRKTQQYRDRFKGLLGLQQRGIPDIRNEAEYLELESN